MPSQAIGGAERHTASLALGLAEANLKVTIAVDPKIFNDFGRLIDPAKLCLTTTRIVKDDLDVQRISSLGLLHETSPDFVIVPLPWPDAGLGAQRALAETKTPTLMIAHLAAQNADMHRLSTADRNQFSNAPMRWVAVSRPVASRIEYQFHLPEGAVKVIPNAVALPDRTSSGRNALRQSVRAELGLASHDRIALFVGRLDESKGADILPDLAAALDAKYDAKLVCAGDGPLYQWLKEKSNWLNGRRLSLLGSRSDIVRLMSGADVLIMPSRIEGSPLVFLEAALAFCPVVATREALECFGSEAVAYATISDAMTPIGLRDAVRKALLNERNTQQYARRAHLVASRYGLADMVLSYSATLRALLGLAHLTNFDQIVIT